MQALLRYTVLALAAAALAGCMLRSSAAGEKSKPAARAVDLVDDARIQRDMIQRTKAMLDAGETSPMEKLFAQRKRTRCSAKLPQASTEKLTPAEIYRRLRHGVLVVTAIQKVEEPDIYFGSSATGFVLTSSGIIVTNYHVVHDHDAEAIGVGTVDGRFFGVKEVLAADKTSDIAVLQTTGNNLTPIPLAADAPVGSPVTVISHPNFHFYVLTHGVVSRYYTEQHNGARRMAITADFAKGSSGGPAINEFGAAAGLVVSTETIYYDAVEDDPRNPQMTIKACATSRDILKLFKPR